MSDVLSSLRKLPDVQAPTDESAFPLTDTDSEATADRTLCDCIKANAELDLVSFRFAVDADLRSSDTFHYRRKLVLAEVLLLLPNQSTRPVSDVRAYPVCDTPSRSSPKRCIWASARCWNDCGPRRDGSSDHSLESQLQSYPGQTLPPQQTSLIIGPNRLSTRPFQKVVRHELRATNLHIARVNIAASCFCRCHTSKASPWVSCPTWTWPEVQHAGGGQPAGVKQSRFRSGGVQRLEIQHHRR